MLASVTKKVTERLKMSSSRFAIAIHVLSLLANSDEKILNSEYLACSVNTNPVVIRRLLCALSAAKLVSSQTGASGGTKLAKNADEITLLDVYRAVDEDKQIFALHRKHPDARCFIGKNIQIVLENIQNELDKAVSEKLGRMKLSDVVRMIDETGEKEFVKRDCQKIRKRGEVKLIGEDGQKISGVK